jgi:hypothetical protein
MANKLSDQNLSNLARFLGCNIDEVGFICSDIVAAAADFKANSKGDEGRPTDANNAHQNADTSTRLKTGDEPSASGNTPPSEVTNAQVEAQRLIGQAEDDARQREEANRPPTKAEKAEAEKRAKAEAEKTSVTVNA